jgi:HNH endonuclease
MTISDKARRIVWIQSGGRCSICRRQVLTPATETDDPSIFGEEAHIVARSPGGPRAGECDKTKIDSHENLILLCSEHHKQVDDQSNHFTVEQLRQIKQTHIEWVASLGENERQMFAQAELVTAWPTVVRSDPADPTSCHTWGAQVHNASELPIYQVHVGFTPIDRGAARSVVIVEVLPPGDWLVSGRKIYLRAGNRSPNPDIWRMPKRTFVIELRFTDTYRQAWQRDRQGVLTQVQLDGDTAPRPQSREEQVAPEFEAAIAQAVGPAMLLLDRMNPLRVTMNVSNAEAEQARWKELAERVDAARERLLIIGAGHPRPNIRELAAQAQVKLANVLHASGWAVHDLLQNRSNPEWMERAQKTHEEANQVLRQLVDATFAQRPGQ